MPIPKSAVIVGGSVSGLLQGLQLKRQGADVILLEQDPSSDRHSHESGLAIGPAVLEMLEKYDAKARPATIPAPNLSIAWRQRPRALNFNWNQKMTNWACLYLILRANFDGKVSETMPEPPVPKETDGTVEYRAGKRVTGVKFVEEKDIMVVDYVDVTSGEQDSVSADVVIGADGVHSTIRKVMKVPTRKEYSGYIAWRGTVPERLLSQKTIEEFMNRLNLCIMKGTYMVSYHIPSETGNIEPGNRLINWVWYFVVPEGSDEMNTIFTDVNGKLHPNTVPHGKIKPDIWSQHVARHISQMTPHLAEVVTKTERPFVTKVWEAEAAASTFYDGRLVLVGDAFTGFRSHMGMASEQAARHCAQMNRFWHGEITHKEREREARAYAKRFLLLNRAIGFTGLGMVWQLCKLSLDYMVLTIKDRLGFL
ncbi:FAD binding domain protein [Penicillium angulare]|uniref:FAD binding domain protein n=1 Tax=Penicillium angulare TaxID=116970 RepID=A0A9W9GD54_9EURO|nr:FAD binding domain protein [Penicillium angulare]